MTSYDKNTLQTLLSNPAHVDEAIRLLGQNQTADELRSKGTHYHNNIGFSAAYARTGTRLYEFVTGIQTRTGQKKWAPKSLAHPVANKVFSRYIRNHSLGDAVELGRKIALVHWRQLESLTTATVASLPTTSGNRPTKKAPAQVTLKGAEIVRRSGKAVQVLWDSKKVWLPTSQISWDSSTEELTLPKWLAGKKGMNPRPYSTSTATMASVAQRMNDNALTRELEAQGSSLVDRIPFAGHPGAPTNPENPACDGQGFNWSTGEEEAAAAEAWNQPCGDDRLSKAQRDCPSPESDEPQHFPMEDSGPQPGTWAYTARMMSQCDDSDFDWDAWKDEMKEANC